MKIILNLVWMLVLLLLGFGIGAFYIIGSKNSTYYSFDYYLEEFILGGISFVVSIVLIGFITFIITKLIGSKNKFKIVLYASSVFVLIFGVQAYFLADDVLLIKQKAIIWEDNERALIANIEIDLLEEGYDKEKVVDFAVCITDDITMDDDFFNKITDQQNMFLFLLESKEYGEYKKRCVNKKEMTQGEKDAFEQEIKELMGD